MERKGASHVHPEVPQPSERTATDVTPSAPERFDADPSAYADYLRTPLGRLRLELSWRNLVPYLPRPARPGGRALDLGAGTGEVGIRLAESGWSVTLVDGSLRMLERAAELARARGLGDRVERHRLDLDHGGLADALGHGVFHLVICHDVLEYLASPDALLREARAALAPGGRISILVRNRAGEAMKRLLRGGDLESSVALLAAARVREDLYGLEPRLFDPAQLTALAATAGFDVLASRGVRVVADHLASWPDGDGAFERVLELEQRLGETPELVGAARYLQIIAAPAGLR